MGRQIYVALSYEDEQDLVDQLRQDGFVGVVRPGHAIPEQHLWSVNDPSVGPTSGWVRGRGVRHE
jgi:hypothetical protein